MIIVHNILLHIHTHNHANTQTHTQAQTHKRTNIHSGSADITSAEGLAQWLLESARRSARGSAEGGIATRTPHSSIAAFVVSMIDNRDGQITADRAQQQKEQRRKRLAWVWQGCRVGHCQNNCLQDSVWLETQQQLRYKHLSALASP